MNYSFEIIKDENFNEDAIVVCPVKIILEVKRKHESVFNSIFTKMNVFGTEKIGYVMGMCKEYNVKSFSDFFERVYTGESLSNIKKDLRGKTKKEIYDIVCEMKEYAKKRGIGDIPLHIFYIYFFDVAFNRTANGFFHECSLNREAEESGKYKVIETKSAYDDSRRGIDSIFEAVVEGTKTHAVQLKPFTFAMGNDNGQLRDTRKSFYKKSKESKYPFYMYFYKQENGYVVNSKSDDSYPNICCFKVEDLFDENGFVKCVGENSNGKCIYQINNEKVIEKIPF